MNRPRTFAALTGARFIAAIVVVVVHMWREPLWLQPWWMRVFIEVAPLTVSFFFALSGFVVSLAYLGPDGALRTTTRGFWRTRWARFLPVHWLGLVLVAFPVLVIAKKQGVGVDVVGGVLSLLCLQSFVPGHELAWNAPMWSLSVEVCFYALFPWVGPRLWRVRRPLLVFALLWMLSNVAGVGYVLTAPDGIDVVTHGTHAPFIDALLFHPLLRLPELLMGVLAARAFANGVRFTHVQGALAFVVALVVAVAAPYALAHNGLCTPLVLVAVLSLATERAPLLGSWPLVRAGEATYALYALHVPLLYWISGLGEKFTGTKVLAQPLVCVVVVVALVVVARIVYVCFEEPLRQRLR